MQGKELRSASEGGDVEAVKSLITAGVDVNDTDEVRLQMYSGGTMYVFPSKTNKKGA